MARFGRDGRRRYALILIVLTSITLITLDQRADDKGPIGAVARVAHRIVAPISGAARSVFGPVGDWLAGITDGGELRDQNRDLKNELKTLQAKIRDAERALDDNKKFKALFDEVWLDDIPSKEARIVAGSPGNFERTVVLSKGTESGIEVGYPVVGPDGLVGRVIDAWDGGSKVLLITDATFGVSVRLQDQRIRGPAEGQSGSPTLKLNLSSADLSEDQVASILPDDRVETCGCDESEYPPGIPVGEVVRTEQQTSGISIIVRIRPYLDSASLEYVKVLLWDPGDPVPSELAATTTTSAPAATTSTTTPSDASEGGG
jgi:rod shape-determining protein MreC